jgi:hypothetical protein
MAPSAPALTASRQLISTSTSINSSNRPARESLVMVPSVPALTATRRLIRTSSRTNTSGNSAPESPALSLIALALAVVSPRLIRTSSRINISSNRPARESPVMAPIVPALTANRINTRTARSRRSRPAQALILIAHPVTVTRQAIRIKIWNLARMTRIAPAVTARQMVNKIKTRVARSPSNRLIAAMAMRHLLILHYPLAVKMAPNPAATTAVAMMPAVATAVVPMVPAAEASSK